MTAERDKRRDVRYPARIVARVVRKNHTLEFLTNDVSFRGVFIRTDAPPALRQLVRVELLIPSTQIVVSGHAMVVHVTSRPEGVKKGEEEHVPGIGLQFWGPIDHQREWEAFVNQLKTRERSGLAAAKATDKVRRASERFKLALEVSFDGARSMTRDVSETGMAVRTDLAMPIGARAEIQLTAGEEKMTFDVIVRRTIDEPGFRGLGVELVDVEPAKREALVRFVRARAPSEDRIFINPGDPKLH